MLAEIVGLAQLAFQFDLHFAAKPILTMMVTNAVRFILSKG
jgi:protein Mpv17